MQRMYMVRWCSSAQQGGTPSHGMTFTCRTSYLPCSLLAAHKIVSPSCQQGGCGPLSPGQLLLRCLTEKWATCKRVHERFGNNQGTDRQSPHLLSPLTGAGTSPPPAL